MSPQNSITITILYERCVMSVMYIFSHRGVQTNQSRGQRSGQISDMQRLILQFFASGNYRPYTIKMSHFTHRKVSNTLNWQTTIPRQCFISICFSAFQDKYLFVLCNCPGLMLWMKCCFLNPCYPFSMFPFPSSGQLLIFPFPLSGQLYIVEYH